MTKMDIQDMKGTITLPKMMYKLEKMSSADTLSQLQSIYASSTISMDSLRNGKTQQRNPHLTNLLKYQRGQNQEHPSSEPLARVEASVEPLPEPSRSARVEASVEPLPEPSRSARVEASVEPLPEPKSASSTPFIQSMEERVKARGYSFRGFLYAPPNDESLVRRVIGKRGYYLYLTTDKNQLDFLWYDKKTNQFLFWGDKPNVIRAMNIMRHRILTKMDSVC
jgi:hypothetical protein